MRDTDVEEEEFATPDEAGAIRTAPRRNTEHDERVLENLDVPPRRLVAQARPLAQRLQVENMTRGGSHQVEEPGETAEVADESLGLDFLPKVRVGVAAEVGGTQRRVALRIDPGERTVRQRAVEVEVVSQFTRGQRVHVVDVDPTRKEVGLAAPELACAGPGQQEPKASGLLVDEQLHHIEQRGYSLDLIDEHRPRLWRCSVELPFKALGLRDKIPEGARAGQIQGEIGTDRGQQRRLPHLPRPEDECTATIGGLEHRSEQSWIHVGKLAGVLPTHK